MRNSSWCSARPGRGPDICAPGATRLFPLSGKDAGQKNVTSARRPAVSAVGAFTIIELVVVILVIVLILAMAVPGLAKLNADARMTSAYQTMNGVLTRAHYLALSERTMTAVRFLPGVWSGVPDQRDPNNPNATILPASRQHMAIYRYVGNAISQSPTGTFTVQFNEYFERAPDFPPVALPEDVWVAPVEALAKIGTYTHVDGSTVTLGGSGGNFGQEFVLNGMATLNDPSQTFKYSADQAPNVSGGFLSADDFLIVMDPREGVRTGVTTLHRLRAYSPLDGYDVDTGRPGSVNPIDWYQRYGFSGVVAYRREALTRLGQDSPSPQARQARQDYLAQSGQQYIAQRFSGGLIPGAARPQQ